MSTWERATYLIGITSNGNGRHEMMITSKRCFRFVVHTSAPAGARPKVQPPPSKRATRPTQRAHKMSGRELGWTHTKSPSMQSPPPRLPSAGGSVRSSVYEFCAAAPKSSRGLGGARELEMGRPAANCPACEQSQVSRTRQGRLERERSDAQACRAGSAAPPLRRPVFRE